VVVREAELHPIRGYFGIEQALFGVGLDALLRPLDRVKELGSTFVVQKALTARIKPNGEPGDGVGSPLLQLTTDEDVNLWIELLRSIQSR
jgi:hypothetical protein